MLSNTRKTSKTSGLKTGNTIPMSKIKPSKQRNTSIFPTGAVSLLVGEPGEGKSQIVASLTALITRGDLGPCGYGKVGKAGKVILVAPEDDFASVLRPRLELAGAELKKVIAWKGAFDLKSDLAKLRREAEKRPTLRAIFIDTLGACFGSLNPNDHRAVRDLFHNLAELAKDRNIAVIGVSHVTKGAKLNLKSIVGSVAFGAAARAIYSVAKTSDGHRILIALKSNAQSGGTAFKYDIVEGRTSDRISSSAVVWRNALHENEIKSALTDDDTFGAIQIMKNIINERTKIPSKELYRAASEHGIGKTRARGMLKKMGFEPRKAGFGSAGSWTFTKVVSLKPLLSPKKHSEKVEDEANNW